jgi:hypothetical protein
MAGGYNTIGYRNGDGVSVVQDQTAVTQTGSITTGVTCNAYSGVITTVSQTVAGGAEASFTVTCDKVAATDVVSVAIKTHTSAGLFFPAVTQVANGSFRISLANLDAAAGNNVLVLNFVVHKAEAA